MNFNDFNWHDSVIKNININRDNPGISDNIIFDIVLAEGGIVELIFEQTYWVNMTLNFGIVAEETILDANMGDSEDADLVKFYSNWKGLMDNIKLDIYLIVLNSTGGVIKIISKGLKIIEK